MTKLDSTPRGQGLKPLAALFILSLKHCGHLWHSAIVNILPISLLILAVGCASTPNKEILAEQSKADCEIPLSDEQEKHFSDYDLKLFKAIDLEFTETMAHFSKPRIPFALVQFNQHMASGLIDDIQILNDGSTLFEMQCRNSVASVMTRFRSVPVSGIHGDHRTVTIRFRYPDVTR